MVLLKVFFGEELCFLYESPCKTQVTELTQEIVKLYNGVLKVKRIASELEELANHGPAMNPEMVGLTEEQVTELKLVDSWCEKYVRDGEYIRNPDPVGRRIGFKPTENKQKILFDTKTKTEEMVSPKLAQTGKCLVFKEIQTALNEFIGAVAIVFPMGLPKYDPIYQELHNIEDLTGTQASLQVIEPAEAILWFCGRQMIDQALGKYCNNNEKSTLIVKLARVKDTCPGRVSAFDEQMKRMLMSRAYNRQEELKKLEMNEDDGYLNSPWADNQQLKRMMHGIGNINFK